MAKLSLWFTTSPHLALEATTCLHSAEEGEWRCVRGKTSGAFVGFGSFQWSTAVKALTVLLLRHASSSSEIPLLIGGRDSLAASLDYCLHKGPVWLIDMFGIDTSGRPKLKHLLRQTNPGRKAGDVTAFAINTMRLAPHDVKVYLDREPVTQPGRLQGMAQEIEAQQHTLRAAERSEHRKPALVPLAV